MNYKAYDMGTCKAGEILEVILKGDGVNVSIMDSPNFFEYKNGRRHKYIGGHIESSPYKVMLPYTAHWYVAIDFGGYPGETKCAVRKHPGKLPKFANEKMGVMRVSTSGGSMDEEDIKSEFGIDLDNYNGVKDYDFFVMYAKEHYKDIAQPLANAMVIRGKKVCLEEFGLEKGDNLSQKVKKGLSQAKRGIIIVSREFVENGWLTYELDEILNMRRGDDPVVIPVWHYIMKDEIVKNCGRAFLQTMEYNTMHHTINELMAAFLNIQLVEKEDDDGDFKEIPFINI